MIFAASVSSAACRYVLRAVAFAAEKVEKFDPSVVVYIVLGDVERFLWKSSEPASHRFLTSSMGTLPTYVLLEPSAAVEYLLTLVL
jgi:hypothetical protein